VSTPAVKDTWVGRALPRLEDESLLRGEGRFIDDLDPVPNARHAAVLRSPFAHARITRLDPAAALELRGVFGVLTGADVAELSRPFPAGIASPIPYFAAAHETTRYVGEPVAVVVARDRYLAEDALELIDVEYEPLEPVLDAEAAVETDACVSDRSFHYGDVEGALAGADLVVSERFRFPRWSCTPVECYGVVADWSAAEGSLTAWANFQGPFTLHSAAAAALGLPGSKLRLITPPDSGGSFGIKSAVFAYVVLMGLASRKLGVPVRWIEDRLEHLAASSSASGRVTHAEAGFTSEGGHARGTTASRTSARRFRAHDARYGGSPRVRTACRTWRHAIASSSRTPCRAASTEASAARSSISHSRGR
jgi:2-furoyl-CoA dehydrogenase large subunit